MQRARYRIPLNAPFGRGIRILAEAAASCPRHVARPLHASSFQRSGRGEPGGRTEFGGRRSKYRTETIRLFVIAITYGRGALSYIQQPTLLEYSKDGVEHARARLSHLGAGAIQNQRLVLLQRLRNRVSYPDTWNRRRF